MKTDNEPFKSEVYVTATYKPKSILLKFWYTILGIFGIKWYLTYPVKHLHPNDWYVEDQGGRKIDCEVKEIGEGHYEITMNEGLKSGTVIMSEVGKPTKVRGPIKSKLS